LELYSKKKEYAIEEYKRYVNAQEYDTGAIIMTEDGDFSPG